MKTVALTRGRSAIVDDEDYEALAAFSWICNSHGYAVRGENMGREFGWRIKQFYMHRQILGFPVGFIDHANGDPLDNRRSNLRIATRAQNAMNRKTRCDSRTGIKGVSVSRGRFKVGISFGGKRRHLGYFDSLEDAKAAYADSATKHFGEFARVSN